MSVDYLDMKMVYGMFLEDDIFSLDFFEFSWQYPIVFQSIEHK